jgi:ribonuclease HI
MNLIAHIDGGARGNPGPAAIGVVVTDEEGKVLFEEGRLIGTATNNEAEYRALIYLLERAASDPAFSEIGAKRLSIHCDSKLLVEQVTGRWKIKEPRLLELYNQVQVAKAAVPFELRIKYVPREDNKRADQLLNQALDKVTSAPPASEYTSF